MTQPEGTAVAADLEFAPRLAALAELCVTRGVNLQPQQELIVSAPLEAAGLVRQVAHCAYAHGAKSVTCLYEDPALVREHLAGSAQALDYAPVWLHRGIAEGLRAGAARLRIVGPYPDILSCVPADRIARAHCALADALRAEEAASSAVNWSVAPFVTGSWAKQVFPGEAEEQARRMLWNAVFQGTRVVDADPLQAWDTGILALNARRDALQSRGFRYLRFFDGRTDLRLELAEGHRWTGGSVVANNGVEGIRSIPSEEVFTALRGNGTVGRVFFSRPLALGGVLVEDLYAEFKHGSVTTLRASRGLETFERLIAGDEGARRLGEVGLVPAHSRLASAGLLFWNPLLDRNAASHVAFGQSPSSALQRLEHSVANESAMHIDCMLGHPSMQVDGITPTGSAIPVMREGAFVL
jgi:aminopeptidase